MFRKLFRREPSFDIDKELGKLMRTLPGFSRRVAIISERYNDIDYECEVVVESSKLVPWAQDHAKNVLGGGDEQVARLALPYFLTAADTSDDRITYLYPSFRSVLRPYVQKFIKVGIAQSYCHTCGKSTELTTEQLNKANMDSSWPSWTDVWTCERGHIVHKKDVKFHIQRACK